jgi:hypothetical protein
MQTLNWLESHLESLDEAIKTLNDDFCWGIEIIEGLNGWWFVKSGESVIFSADNRDAVDAFIYGMGMFIMGVPDPLFDDLSKGMKSWCDDITGNTTTQSE